MDSVCNNGFGALPLAQFLYIRMTAFMNARTALHRALQNEELNFLLTNRIPRTSLTRLMGWLSRIEHPWVSALLIAIWRVFTDLDLSDAKKDRFRSLHECFTRELREGARPLDEDPTVIISPCDGIVGQCGTIHEGEVFQAKGLPYSIQELFGGDPLAQHYRGGTYVTVRLTSAMYHRFHAPDAMHLDRVVYISGDTWNVNPIALARVERLFCRNERALVSGTLHATNQRITLVAVAAVLVASIRLTFADIRLHLRYRGPNVIDCNANVDRGQTLGWFEHGSTILLFAPEGFSLAEGIGTGARIRMGQALMQRTP
jgi:phosphatidylserine decarboxylase